MSDQIGMIRGKTKGGNTAVGWYFPCGSKHYLLLNDVQIWQSSSGKHISNRFFVEIDISTAAVATGKKDKNDEMIFGSRGEMQGGDTVQASEGGLTDATEVYWNKENVWWALGVSTLGSWKSDNLEIIKPEEGK